VPERSVEGFSTDQLAELRDLLLGADTVELKLSVPDVGRGSAVAALGMDPLQAQIRQVAFFDTPELALSDCGVVVRIRRVQGKDGDAVVKLRPIVPSELPDAVRTSSGFGVEVDAMPGRFVCSGSMKAAVEDGRALAVIRDGAPVKKLFTVEQRSLFDTSTPPGVEMDQLSMLGPINVLKLKFTPKGLRYRLVAELWYYPDGSRLLELSTKCPPNRAFEVAAEFRAFLAEHGIDLSAEQQTKTRKALEFFAHDLEGGSP
jgi:hypothetical protein